jgi:hypothetical protein
LVKPSVKIHNFIRSSENHVESPLNSMRTCLAVFLTYVALSTATYAATFPPIQMHSGWVTFKNIEGYDGFKTFRRYGYSGDDASFPNLTMFNCSKDVSKAASHLTFVLPKTFKPDSFPRSAWFPKIDVRFLINSNLSILMSGEYRNGELYFDLDTDSKDNFDRIMLADTLAIGFGDKNDIVQFEFTEKIDRLFAGYIEKLDNNNLGEMTHYPRKGVGSVAESCTAYQNAVSEKPLGPEESLIILFSMVSALEIDCSFKAKRGELQKLANADGFRFDDFLPNGRFSRQVRERIDYNHGFIKEKGCGVVRGIVRRNCPSVGG